MQSKAGVLTYLLRRIVKLVKMTILGERIATVLFLNKIVDMLRETGRASVDLPTGTSFMGRLEWLADGEAEGNSRRARGGIQDDFYSRKAERRMDHRAEGVWGQPRFFYGELVKASF